MARALCTRCGLHPNTCVCEVCEQVDNRHRVIILQHPSEVGHSKGTVRVLQQCLTRLEVLVGESPASFSHQGLERLLTETRSGLLFPCADSQPVESNAAGQIDQWLVLDGTWRKAAKILHLNPQFRQLPCFHFADPPASRYRIRKAPKAGQLSTAEAVAYLFTLTEPATDTEPLLRAQDVLIRKRLAFVPDHHKSKDHEAPDPELPGSLTNY